jgi:hypothetical protein
VNIPVSDHFAIRVSAQTEQPDTGYWFSPFLGQDLGEKSVFRERFQALWQATR